MNKLRLSTLIAILALCSSLPEILLAQETQPTYVGGRQLCEQESGAWIQVPFQYQLRLHGNQFTLEEDSSQGHTEIFYKVYAEGRDLGAFLRPGKPTLLYFEGGPAGSASSRANFFKDISLEFDINVLTFEIRGVSCSRPESYALYQNPENYSAFSIAGDAKKLIDHLGLQEVLVYGLSYGTFPARLFSYLYQDVTKATLLEGTLSLEPNSRQEDGAMINSLRDLYGRLFFSSPARVLSFFSYLAQSSDQIFSAWADRYLHGLTTVASYQGRKGLEQYTAEIESAGDIEKFQDLIVNYQAKSPWRTHPTPGGLGSVDYYLLDIYLCRDFDRRGSLSQSPIGLTRQGIFQPQADGGFSKEWNAHFNTHCLLQKRPSEQSLEAILQHHGGSLPIKNPVLFFNGGYDATTPSEAALKEAGQINTSELLFLEFTDQGHAPWNLTHLEGSAEQKAILHNILGTWFRSGRLELSLEDVQFMQEHQIQLRSPGE